jgi:hypothetical protein
MPPREVRLGSRARVDTALMSLVQFLGIAFMLGFAAFIVRDYWRTEWRLVLTRKDKRAAEPDQQSRD